MAMSLAVVGAIPAPVHAASGYVSGTSRVSVSNNGKEGNDRSFAFAISDDGRYVAFDSSATNLVTGDTNGTDDVFVRDRGTKKTQRISVSSTGTQADAWSSGPSISADGRYVVFVSAATNLVAGDTNGLSDVFLRDLHSGTIRRVDVVAPGGQQDFGLHNATISADGQSVVLSTIAPLVPGDTNGQQDVFVHDLVSGATSLVSVPDSGGSADGPSFWPWISVTGRYVAFVSWASNMVSGDTNGVGDVFLRDRVTGSTTRVSLSDDDQQAARASFAPAVSADGRYVSFTSEAPALVPGDTGSSNDVFVRDLVLGTTTLVSATLAGAPGNNTSGDSVITPDGRYVAFGSDASDLVAADTNGQGDLFVRDLWTGQITLASVSGSGEAANGPSANPRISADGRHVAFNSWATDLVSGDTNNQLDVFIRDF
ncbi:TolB family protein [Micromonospora chersina]|uniref:TolB family protein n=1 Tax=Micromonospora chersina TaxID=47854 RepID=UPI00372278AE